jgi:putative aldouronate transport system substrate-binding protein
MKKGIVIFATLALIFTAGCSKKDGSAEAPAAVKPREITVISISMGPIHPGVQEVEDEINKITIPGIDTKVKYQLIEGASYVDQLNLMMSSGEKADVLLTIPVGTASFVSMLSQNQLMDITDLVNTHAKETVGTLDNVIPGMLKGTSRNRKVYGITSLYNKVTSLYWLFRDDLLQKHNIDVSGVKNLDDIEALLEIMKAAEPLLAPIMPGQSDGVIMTGSSVQWDISTGKPVIYDPAGESIIRLGVAFLNNTGQIVNAYKSDYYKTFLPRLRSWYQKDYIYKDSAFMTDDALTIVKAGKAFSWMDQSELGLEAVKSAATGYPIKAIKLADKLVSTDDINKFAWVVPVHSTEGEAGVKFINLIYTDARISNLMAWGIEGRDYVAKADGTVGFPEGKDSNSVFHGEDFLVNQYLCKVWEGNPPDLKIQALALNKAATLSPIMGFSFDFNIVANEFSAITNVINQYRPGLESGSSDIDREYPRYIEALDRAGAEKVITEMQRQLDEWRAQN